MQVFQAQWWPKMAKNTCEQQTEILVDDMTLFWYLYMYWSLEPESIDSLHDPLLYILLSTYLLRVLFCLVSLCNLLRLMWDFRPKSWMITRCIENYNNYSGICLTHWKSVLVTQKCQFMKMLFKMVNILRKNCLF